MSNIYAIDQFADPSTSKDWLEIDNANGIIPFKSGLSNFNQNCYLNSILQCIFGNKNFQVHFNNSDLIESYINNEEIFNSVYILNRNMYQNIGYINTNKKYIQNIIRNCSFKLGDQQDAHEFLVRFLTVLQTAFDVFVADRIITADIQAFLKDMESISIQEKIVCENQHQYIKKFRESIFLIISSNNLKECIDNFFNEHIYNCTVFNCKNDANICNGRLCEMCTRHVRVCQNKFLESLPETLIVSLKIFTPQVKKFNKFKKYVLLLLFYFSKLREEKLRIRFIFLW
jgi:uncharacterized UBP type Zn finger protein